MIYLYDIVLLIHIFKDLRIMKNEILLHIFLLDTAKASDIFIKRA